jgi:hypothetical protein
MGRSYIPEYSSRAAIGKSLERVMINIPAVWDSFAEMPIRLGVARRAKLGFPPMS